MIDDLDFMPPLRFDEEYASPAVIKVIGIGGAGGNAVNRMIEAKIKGVEFIVANTDAQALMKSKALQKLQIGSSITKGLGVGGNPEIGRLAAEEDRDSIKKALEGSDMVFITAGMGGGTGTGGCPVVAEIVHQIGAMSVAVVTRPFRFERKKRHIQAEQGISELRELVDTMLIIPNDKLFIIVNEGTTFDDALRLADDVLMQAVKGISEVVTLPGLINVDFADVKAIMSEKGGSAIMGLGCATGDGRATRAVQQAIRSPLLDGANLKGARGILLNISGGRDITKDEIEEITSEIESIADEEANLIFGVVIKDGVDEISVTVIATGFPEEEVMFEENISKIEDYEKISDINSNVKVQRQIDREEKNVLKIPTFLRKERGIYRLGFL
ncbi:MAG: cell division protein FtsZ [bacterium]